MPESANNGSAQETKTEYYYDLTSKQLLLGKLAYERHLEESQGTTAIYRLGQLLRDTTIEIEPLPYKRQKYRSKEDLLAYGHWLTQVVDPPRSPKERILNEQVLVRANRLRLGPSSWQIERHPDFGTISRYYAELGVGETKRIGIFNGWDRKNFVNYLKNIQECLGRKPTKEDLVKASSENTSYPSYKIIADHFGSLGKAYEAIGYPDVSNWSDFDYFEWGANFMKANDGLEPTQAGVDYLSRMGYGPSATNLRLRFGNHSEYKKLVFEHHEAKQKKLEQDRLVKEERIKRLANSGKLPPELTAGPFDSNDKLRMVAKFLVLDELFGENNIQSKLSISLELTNTVKREGFIRSVRKINNAITPGDIECTALYLGVFDDIWPIEAGDISNLRLPDEILTNALTAQSSKKDKVKVSS